MRLIFIGPPGAGKGTQAERLSAHFKIPRLTTGDLFRQAIQNETPLGKKVQGIMAQGSLVSDTIVLELMVERMSASDCKQGFILDGFPRTIGQAEGLDQWLARNKLILDQAVAIEINQDEALRRNTGRRQCGACGKAYHLNFQPPKKEGVCDLCGGKLKQREDDKEATVRHRLQVYEKETAPLLKFYADKNLLKKINGAQSPDTVFQSILSLVK